MKRVIRESSIHLSPLLLVVGLAVAPGAASADEFHTVISAATGSGMSLGTGGGALHRKRSPAFLDIDLGLVFDEDRSIEWTPSLIMELEGRTSFGMNPSVKKLVRWRKLALYGGLGLPFFFAPFRLLGAEAAVGAIYPFAPRLAAVVELRTDAFFVGTDLPKGSVLVKVDLAVGLRFDLF